MEKKARKHESMAGRKGVLLYMDKGLWERWRQHCAAQAQTLCRATADAISAAMEAQDADAAR